MTCCVAGLLCNYYVGSHYEKFITMLPHPHLSVVAVTTVSGLTVWLMRGEWIDKSGSLAPKFSLFDPLQVRGQGEGRWVRVRARGSGLGFRVKVRISISI